MRFPSQNAGLVGGRLTCTFWCSGLRKLEPAMAKSTQSTLRSSRLQMVPGEGMASAGWGQMGLEERASLGSMHPPFHPLFSPCFPPCASEPSRQAEGL